MDLSDKAVAETREGLNVNGGFGGIVKDVADTLDGVIQAVIEINESVGGPKGLVEFLALDKVSGFLEEKAQNLKCLGAEAKPDALVEQLLRGLMKFKGPEADRLIGARFFHGITWVEEEQERWGIIARARRGRGAIAKVK